MSDLKTYRTHPPEAPFLQSNQIDPYARQMQLPSTTVVDLDVKPLSKRTAVSRIKSKTIQGSLKNTLPTFIESIRKKHISKNEVELIIQANLHLERFLNAGTSQLVRKQSITFLWFHYSNIKSLISTSIPYTQESIKPDCITLSPNMFPELVRNNQFIRACKESENVNQIEDSPPRPSIESLKDFKDPAVYADRYNNTSSGGHGCISSNDLKSIIIDGLNAFFENIAFAFQIEATLPQLAILKILSTEQLIDLQYTIESLLAGFDESNLCLPRVNSCILRLKQEIGFLSEISDLILEARKRTTFQD